MAVSYLYSGILVTVESGWRKQMRKTVRMRVKNEKKQTKMMNKPVKKFPEKLKPNITNINYHPEQIDKKGIMFWILKCLGFLTAALLINCLYYDLHNNVQEHEKVIPMEEKKLWWALDNIVLPYFMVYVTVNLCLILMLEKMILKPKEQNRNRNQETNY